MALNTQNIYVIHVINFKKTNKGSYSLLFYLNSIEQFLLHFLQHGHVAYVIHYMESLFVSYFLIDIFYYKIKFWFYLHKMLTTLLVQQVFTISCYHASELSSIYCERVYENQIKTATYAASADHCYWNRVNKGLNLLAVVPFDGLSCLTLSPLLPLPVIAPNMVQSAEDNNAEQRCGYDEQNWRTKLIVRNLLTHLQVLNFFFKR